MYGKEILRDQFGTQDAGRRECLAQCRLEIARGAAQADVDTAAGRVARIDALREAADAARAHVASLVIDAAFNQELVAVRTGVDCAVTCRTGERCGRRGGRR